VVIGLTGLPAAGKSTVAGMFGDLGARVVDADALAREALESPAGTRAAERALGTRIRGRDGRVDRRAVASLVFGGGDPGALGRLVAVLHPGVRRRLRAEVAAARRAGAAAVVLDVPLLFEGGVDGLCDLTVFVAAPREIRRRRARARGWTARELAAREARQWPAAVRRRLADATVDSGGSRSAAWKRVREIWRRATEARDGRR
jgi:dephospho-CoA kinase